MGQIIIDTREAFEYAMSHVEGAINISSQQFVNGEFKQKLKGVEKDDQIILYCRTGHRSNTCSMFLRDAGYENIVNGVNENRVRQLIQG